LIGSEDWALLLLQASLARKQLASEWLIDYSLLC
jgi:hypothetical protein